MYRVFINFSFTIIVVIAASSCKPQTGPAGAAQEVFRTNQVLFDAMIRKIYLRNPNFTLPGRDAVELNVFDFDHTLTNTETMIPIRDGAGKVIDRRDSKCFHVRKGETADFTVFTRAKLMAGTAIKQTVERARAHNRAKGALVFVVTARSQAHTFQSARTYLSGKGVQVNGVIAVNSELVTDNLWKKLKLPAGMKKLPRGMKKPLLIAALLEFAHERNAQIKTIRYYEDTDKYIKAYIDFMSHAYPAVVAEVYDYIRTGKPNLRNYREVLVARIEDGKPRNSSGDPFIAPESYDSKDCPLK